MIISFRLKMTGWLIVISVILFAAFWMVAIARTSRPGGLELFDQNMAGTKAQFDAVRVKQAISPLFTENFTNIQSTNLPPEITSLPLFAGDIQNLSCYHAPSNSLIFECGGAFGQWGLIVSRNGESTVTNLLSPAEVAMPWSQGIFFWREK